MNPPRPCTLDEVARAVGVNRSTVSRALGRHPSIPAATRERIVALAEAMGYRPNPMVAALMTYRRAARREPQHAVLAYVTRYPARPGGALYPQYFRSLFEGAAARAAQQGYRLEEFSLETPRMTPRRLCDILRSRGIRGLLIAPLPEAHAHLELDWADCAAVALGMSLATPQLHRVANDYFHSMVVAMRRCRKDGFRRPGLALRARVNERVEQRWLAAYRIEQQLVDASNRLDPLIARPWNYRTFRDWIRAQQPDVVIGTETNQLAAWLDKLERGAARRTALVSLDRQPGRDSCSGIAQDYTTLGGAAVDFLIGMLHRGETGVPVQPISLLLEGRWEEPATGRTGR